MKITKHKMNIIKIQEIIRGRILIKYELSQLVKSSRKEPALNEKLVVKFGTS